MKKDNAFTGLEAAIVLIAFVVVAAIFSYVMLGAGFFATQKAQEVTYAGVKQTTSNLIPGGTLYGSVNGTGATASLEELQLSLTVPVGGQSQQLKDLLITFSQENKIPWNFNHSTSVRPGSFTIVSCSEDVIVGGERLTAIYDPSDLISSESVLVPPGNSCDAVLQIAGGPTAGHWFQLEIKPPVGAPTTFRKTIPTGYKGGKLL